MNRWIQKTVVLASMTSALALVPAGAALAQQTATPPGTGQQGQTSQPGAMAHRRGLLGEALELDSLTADQRATIEALVGQRRAAAAPVRAADAQLLTVLAQQVEQASVDPAALAPSLGAEESAATAESALERDAINRLHGVLTPAQRGALVDRVLADHAHRGGEHGRGHDGGAPGEGHGFGRGGRAWAGAWAAKLGLTADQKAQIVASLRASGQADGGARGQWRAQRSERRQALEAFRGDSFDASALVHVEHRGERAERLAEAAVPVLTPAQRAILASALRARAAHS
jgi:Spy/CpxP family protein refolding chaperone